MSKLATLARHIEKADMEMRAELERLFPKGTQVRVYIMYGQVKPSVGNVVCYPGGTHALVRVRLHSKKQRCRDVPGWDIRY